jgi:hypothetical protein
MKKGSKTKESGRTDMLVRMPPELKSRIEAAAKEAGISNNDWVLSAIEASLADRDAEARKRGDIEALEHRQEMKFEQIVELVALKNRFGDLASMSREKRNELDAEAEIRLEKWREKEAMDHLAKPATDLERLCKEHDDLRLEIERLESGYHPPQYLDDDDNLDDDDDLDDDEEDGAE